MSEKNLVTETKRIEEWNWLLSCISMRSPSSRGSKVVSRLYSLLEGYSEYEYDTSLKYLSIDFSLEDYKDFKYLEWLVRPERKLLKPGPAKELITLFHVSPVRNIQSILKKGLLLSGDPNLKSPFDDSYAKDYMNAVFLDLTPEQAKLDVTNAYSYNKNWALFKVVIPRAWANDTDEGVVVINPIPPKMITLLSTYRVD